MSLCSRRFLTHFRGIPFVACFADQLSFHTASAYGFVGTQILISRNDGARRVLRSKVKHSIYGVWFGNTYSHFAVV